MAERIFVQMAAYRDPQLLPTLADCLASAADPSRLRFGICWQRDETESLEPYASDPRFRIIDVDYRRSRGTCWARNRIQQLYDGEEYTIQLDSHHRFAEGWDDQCISMLRELQRGGSAKPILTSYAPPYFPEEIPERRDRVPLYLRFLAFSLDGPVEVRPESMDDFETLPGPVPARFFSAHFAFSLGRLCHEVPHDPKLYFFGEEPTLAVRAFTHGYDLFHPNKTLVWHHYGRDGAPKHWADHAQWTFHDLRSLQRVRQLLRIDGTPCETDFGSFGLGTERSLRDFAVYSGFHYGLRGVSDHALRNALPPEPDVRADDPDWEKRFVREQKFRVQLLPDEIPAEPRDFDFWFVGAHSNHGVELYRYDLQGDELESFVRNQPHAREFSFFSPQLIESWTVWPHSASRGWLTKITRNVEGRSGASAHPARSR